MGRVHSHRHGKSHSIRPITQSSPTWVKQNAQEIEELVLKYAKDGLTTSEIGVKLRDQYAIPLVRSITKKSVTEILEQKGIKQEMPEDLNNIVRKALGLQKHLKTHTSDRRNVRSLELDRKSTRLNSSHIQKSRMPSSA